MRTFARSAVAFTLALMLSAVYLAFRAAHAQQNCVTAPNGVVAWYPFDGNGYDVQGGNHATLTGGPAFAAGKVGQALQFDGADDSAKAPSSPGLNVGAGGGMTVALWINPAETNSRPLVEWNSGVISGCEFCPIGTHFWIAQSNNGAPGMLFANLIKVEGGNQVIQSDPGIITPNTYQHVALTYDKASGVARLYRNGVVVAEQSNLGSFTPQTSFDLYFGFRPAGSGINSRYKGAMDEAQIFNRALPQADIQTIFNATALCRQQSLQFLSGTLAVNEASGAATLAVRRRGELTGTATVQYATTANGTATPNADYTTVSGTLTFAEGEATKTITIPINVDAITEPDETFQVTLSNPTGGAALSTPTTETVTIVDPRSTTQLGRILTSTGASQGGIIEFNTDGSNTTNLTANTFDGGCNVPPYKDSNPSVSRDGKRIAFISNRDLSGPGRQPRIFVMNSDGSDVRQLTFNVAEGNFQADQVRDLNPVISPDGTRVAFISNRAVETVTPNNGTSYQVRPNDIYVVNTDGTNLRRVTGLQKNANGDAASNIVSVAWSPDGTTLAFYGIRSRQIEDPPGTKRIVTEQG
ncbi:MAG TPA: LamG-like jellyroll fold domain-containing protein, partial [Pyrinomonadaceae bacterium]